MIPLLVFRKRSLVLTQQLPPGPRFNQLLKYDSASAREIIGDLAESWELAKDGRSYILRIHEAIWHDGSPVTAGDIVFSLGHFGLTAGQMA